MPTDAAGLDLQLIRAAKLLDTDPAKAAVLAKEILELAPDHTGATLLLGTAERNSGNAEAALNLIAKVIADRPLSGILQLEFGRAAAAADQTDAARAAFEQAVHLEPNLVEAWRELSRLYASQGETTMCDAAYVRVANLTPYEAHLGEVAHMIGTRRLDAAELLLKQLLAQSPLDIGAKRMLAEIATTREDFREAERILKECLAMEPGCAAVRFDLAVALHSQQKPGPMLPLLDRLLVQEPDSLAYRSLKASALTLLGRNAESTALLAALTAEVPENAKVWMNYGHALRASGHYQDAIAAYRRSIHEMPDYGEAYFSLANLKTFRFESHEIQAMREHIARDNVADSNAVQFEFALGKALEDAGDFGESFKHYERGNALRRESVYYDAENTSRQMRRPQLLFTRDFVAARADWGLHRDDPIFIVGLPRSGSTLLEQILASHSQVEGTRELPDVPELAHELGGRPAKPAESAYPESVAGLSREQLRALGARYLDQTRVYRMLGRAHFIDKMPNNFMNIGLIHLMLPNARIIDARRHPLSCCFSNFKQHFQLGLHFTYNMEDLAQFYRDYVRLMAHFDAALPGRVHRVYYEHLVENPEVEVRRLLNYCHLPFESSCLRFYETRRTVQTASSEQVRQPLYSESVDQWRHFEPWLGGLKALLDDLVQDYPPAAPVAPVRP